MKMNKFKLSRLQLTKLSAILLIALIIVIYTVKIYQIDYQRAIEREAITLTGYNKEVSNTLKRKFDFINEYNRSMHDLSLVELKMAMLNLQNVTEESHKEMAEDYPVDEDRDYYLLNEKLEVVYESDREPLNLSAEELKLLIDKGELEIGNRLIIAEPYQSGPSYLVIACTPKIISINELKIKFSSQISYIVADNETQEVLDRSEDAVSASFLVQSVNNLPDTPLITRSGIQVYRLERENRQYMLSVSSSTLNQKPVTIYTFTKGGMSKQTALFTALFAAVMMTLFILCVLMLIHKLQKRRFSDNPNAKIIIQRSYRYHLFSTLATVGIAFLIAFMLLYFVHNILQINEEVNTTFENINELSDNYEYNQTLIYNDHFQVGQLLTDDIAFTVKYDYSFDTNELMKNFAKIIGANEISVFDKDGVIIHSTTPYIGYHLSKSETDPEYRLWELLNGGSRQISFYSDTEKVTYFATRRIDDVGIVLLKTSNSVMSSLFEEIELADYLKLQDYAEAYKMYVMREKPETLYVIKSGSNIEKAITNTLPMPDSGKTFISTRAVNGQEFLIVSTGSRDWVIMLAYPMRELWSVCERYLLISAVTGLLIALIALWAFTREESDKLAESSEDIDAYDAFIYEKKRVRNYIISGMSVITIILIFVRFTLFGNFSDLLEYYNNYEKELNLLSLTYIIMLVGINIGLILLIDIINTWICKILTPKGTTIATLITSLFKVVLFASLVINSLEQLGINATAITASLGLTGLALGIGSKDIISDLVAGLFIIFEGQIQLGDYIQVNNFSGFVSSLGIRTITLKNHNKEMIINNTDLKNVLNNSRGTQWIMLDFVVPYYTDLNKLKDLLESSSERFITASGNGLLSGFKFFGVNSFKEYGVECRIAAPVLDSKIAMSNYACRTELIKILHENGIQMASYIPL